MTATTNRSAGASARLAVVQAPRSIAIETRPVPEPGAGEALVRVRECGICGSDVKMWSGRHPVLRPPMVLGHEFYGTIEALGSGATLPEGLEPGHPATVFPTVGCGHCFNCRRGWPHLCVDMELIGGQRQGGLSELVAVPADNLLPLDPAVPEALRALVEPLAVGVHAARRGQVDPDEQVLVVGAGPIGLFTALALQHQGVHHVTLSDLSEARLALAREVGAGETVRVGESPVDHVRRAVRPEGVDVAFECVGSSATAALALESTCKGGRAVLVGLAPAELPVDGVRLQRGERTLVGVQMYTRDDFREAMAILAAGTLSGVDGVIAEYGLDDVPRALEAMERGEAAALKAVVRP